MPKKLTVLILALTVLLFSACGKREPLATQWESTTAVALSDENVPYSSAFAGVWISYIEIMGKCGSESEFTAYMSDMFRNFSRTGITDVFFHVRPFADALYHSQVFPTSDVMCENQGDELSFDPLDTVLKIAKEHNMSLHAWINPYRASRDSDITKLSADSKVRQWYESGRDEVVLVGDRLYLNPACLTVQKFITDGAAELLRNYPDLAGIHIDDYFYPENCGDFDSALYDAYLIGGGELTVNEWRRDNVTGLVKELYTTVKSFGKDKTFSISPTGKIDTCINKLYADVELWASASGYCDMLLPQIYFGFENESQPFVQCLEGWIKLCEGSEVRLVPALALYKCGKEDAYAGESGSQEWINNDDIIKRQVEYIKSRGLYGFALYSGSYVNFSESFYEKELDNLMSVL